jgi:hypothetical protein
VIKRRTRLFAPLYHDRKEEGGNFAVKLPNVRNSSWFNALSDAGSFASACAMRLLYHDGNQSGYFDMKNFQPHKALSWFSASPRKVICRNRKVPKYAERLPVRRFAVRQAKKVVHACPVKLSQGNQRGTGNIQGPAFIPGIGRLADAEQLRQLLLGQIMVFPQISNMLIQDPHPIRKLRGSLCELPSSYTEEEKKAIFIRNNWFITASKLCRAGGYGKKEANIGMSRQTFRLKERKSPRMGAFSV